MAMDPSRLLLVPDFNGKLFSKPEMTDFWLSGLTRSKFRALARRSKPNVIILGAANSGSGFDSGGSKQDLVIG